jgi:hypothetical protein
VAGAAAGRSARRGSDLTGSNLTDPGVPCHCAGHRLQFALSELGAGTRVAQAALRRVRGRERDAQREMLCRAMLRSRDGSGGGSVPVMSCVSCLGPYMLANGESQIAKRGDCGRARQMVVPSSESRVCLARSAQRASYINSQLGEFEK